MSGRVQWLGENYFEMCRFANANPHKAMVGVGFGILDIHLPETVHRLHWKDYLVKKDDGSLTVERTKWKGKYFHDYPESLLPK